MGARNQQHLGSTWDTPSKLAESHVGSSGRWNAVQRNPENIALIGTTKEIGFENKENDKPNTSNQVPASSSSLQT